LKLNKFFQKIKEFIQINYLDNFFKEGLWKSRIGIKQRMKIEYEREREREGE
jgi:hypothetical protein